MEKAKLVIYGHKNILKSEQLENFFTELDSSCQRTKVSTIAELTREIKTGKVLVMIIKSDDFSLSNLNLDNISKLNNDIEFVFVEMGTATTLENSQTQKVYYLDQALKDYLLNKFSTSTLSNKQTMNVDLNDLYKATSVSEVEDVNMIEKLDDKINFEADSNLDTKLDLDVNESIIKKVDSSDQKLDDVFVDQSFDDVFLEMTSETGLEEEQLTVDSKINFDSSSHQDSIKIQSIVSPELGNNLGIEASSEKEETKSSESLVDLMDVQDSSKNINLENLELSDVKNDLNLDASINEDPSLTGSSDDVGIQELKSEIQVLKDFREKSQQTIDSIKQEYDKKLQNTQSRLDDAVFRATKAEKKFLDFKDNIRKEFSSVKGNEQALKNKLEIQKQDAETLITAKDNELLSYKNKISELELELKYLNDKISDNKELTDQRISRIKQSLENIQEAKGLLEYLNKDEAA